VLFHRVAESPGDAIDGALEPRIAEGLDSAAVSADEMVMVVAVRGRCLVARDSVAGIDALHEPQLGECVERSIHGCDSDRTPCPAEPVKDFLCAEAAVLAAEQLDHGSPRASAAEAASLERF